MDFAISLLVRSNCVSLYLLQRLFQIQPRAFISRRQISVGYSVFYSRSLNISCQLLDFLVICLKAEKQFTLRNKFS